MPDVHALLSASSAHIWLKCPVSPRWGQSFPDRVTNAALEGTLAHSVAELKVRSKFLGLDEKVCKAEMTLLTKENLYNEEMQFYTDTYIDTLVEESIKYQEKPFVAAEARLDFSDYAREGFGTGDCVMIGGNTIKIFDFKYGKGIRVFAENNPQMMLYAAGALKTFAPFYGDCIENIEMTIIQPRIGHVDSWKTTKTELLNWCENTVKPKAEEAFKGTGEASGGDWCRFCKVPASCRARCGKNTALEDFAGVTATLSNEELAELLPRARVLAEWASELEKLVLEKALAGEKLPGWKVVEGGSRRKIVNPDATAEALKKIDISEESLYKRELVSLTKLEALVGKKRFTELCGEWVQKPKGAPTLAAETDKRPAWNSAISDFSGLEYNTQNNESED